VALSGAEEYVPAGQDRHAIAGVVRPVALEYVPCVQLRGVQSRPAAAAADEYLPGEHAEQEELASAEAKEPREQTRHAVLVI